jgi:hypothetical protein
MVWSRGRQTNLLRSTLREFYPAALQAFDDLSTGDALEVLRVAPTPTLGAGLSLSKIAAALRRGGRQRRIEARALEIQTALRTPQLHQPAAVATAMGVSVSSLVAVIATMGAQIAQLAGELETGFEQHPAAGVVRSLPGLGTILGARVLGEFGDDPNRYATAKCRKIMPAHHPSPAPREKEGGPGPLRPQPAPRRRNLPVGLRHPHHLARSPSLPRRPPSRRRHPPRRP